MSTNTITNTDILAALRALLPEGETLTLPEGEAAAHAAMDSYAGEANELTRRLREAVGLAGFGREDAEPLVTRWAAVKYSCPLQPGKGKATGRLVLTKGHPAFENAKRAKTRMFDALMGDANEETSAKADPRPEIVVPEDVAALAARLVAACKRHTEDKKLAKAIAAKAVADAFAAK